MGSSAWNVFTDEEVKELDVNEKELLKKHVLHQVLTSSDIHQIVLANPQLLRQVVANPQIKKKLRTKAGALHKRLKKKK